jgi:hypothetical protein
MIPSPHSAPLAALLQRVREEYREMPGLALTKPQATRLFGVAPSVCAAVLKALVMENFLSRTREGVFIRVVASIGLVAGLAAVLSAQAPPSNGKVDPNGVNSIRVQVIGCVTGDADAGRYILTGAFLSGDDTPPTVGTAGKLGSGKDLAFENSPSYDVVGARLKAHMGHKVEIIGITSDAKLNNRDALSSTIGASTHEKTTLTVDSVTMLAAKCR